jgi:hypothetical protein
MPLFQGDVSWITAPGVVGEKLFLEVDLPMGIFFDPYRVQVKITANFGQVGVNINEYGFVTSLKKMARPPVSTIVIDRVGSVEPLHEGLEIRLWSHEKEMKVVGHQDVGVHLDSVGFDAAGNYFKKFPPIRIVGKNRLSLVPPAGHMVPGTGELNAQGPSHELNLAEAERLVKLIIKL